MRSCRARDAGRGDDDAARREIGGRLADLRVEEGARVREGEVIARLESQDYDAQVRCAQAQVQQAEAQRQLGLNERLWKNATMPAATQPRTARVPTLRWKQRRRSTSRQDAAPAWIADRPRRLDVSPDCTEARTSGRTS